VFFNSGKRSHSRQRLWDASSTAYCFHDSSRRPDDDFGLLGVSTRSMNKFEKGSMSW